MKTSAALGLWQDRPPAEALTTAVAVEQAGYPELWVGEMATWDSFALATAIGLRTRRIPLTIGPLPVTVRDPAMIAMGAASIAEITGRDVGVALGTSSELLVRDWHGRSRQRAATALAESTRAVRALLDGGKSAVDGDVVRSVGYRLRLPPPRSPITVAAFGPQALRIAARQADRVVLNLVSPATAADLVEALHAESARIGTPAPPVAVWVTAAIDPGAAAIDQLRRALVSYLAAPGYAAMFRREGFGDLVDLAERQPHPRELLASVPVELISAVGLAGSADDAAKRLRAYAESGVDEIAVVPCCTDDDPAGARTLRTVPTLTDERR